MFFNFLKIVMPLLLTQFAMAEKIKLSNLDKKVLEYQKYEIEHNPRVHFKLDSIEIESKKIISNKFYEYDLLLTIKMQGKVEKSPYVVFVEKDGSFLTNTLVDLKTKKRLESQVYENFRNLRIKKEEEEQKSFHLDEKYYNDEHLISGNKNAKYKILVLSDPLCVACIQTLPFLFEKVHKNKDVALYYYNFPLVNLHPTAMTIVKAMILAEHNGIKNVQEKVYKYNFMKKYDVYQLKDQKKALSFFNELFNTDYKLADINKKLIADKIKSDMSLGDVVKLKGTPTILLNGSLFKAREDIAEL